VKLNKLFADTLQKLRAGSLSKKDLESFLNEVKHTLDAADPLKDKQFVRCEHCLTKLGPADEFLVFDIDFLEDVHLFALEATYERVRDSYPLSERYRMFTKVSLYFYPTLIGDYIPNARFSNFVHLRQCL